MVQPECYPAAKNKIRETVWSEVSRRVLFTGPRTKHGGRRGHLEAPGADVMLFDDKFQLHPFISLFDPDKVHSGINA